MRVVTTWVCFEREEIEEEPESRTHRLNTQSSRGEEPDFGIGIGWFAGDTSELKTPIDNLKIFRPLRHERRDDPLNVELLRNCIDLFLMDANASLFDLPDRSIKNEKLVEYVLSQPFVIERSPPIHVTLKGLINATNLPVWIGTYMGWHAVSEPSVLLFITVPGGIIIVSSAVGLANALSAGISGSVKRLFKTR